MMLIDIAKGFLGINKKPPTTSANTIAKAGIVQADKRGGSNTFKTKPIGCAKLLGTQLSLIFVLLFTSGVDLYSAEKPVGYEPKRLEIDNLDYIGAFRIPKDTFGDSRAAYAEGTITLGANGDSLYLVGHAQQQSVAEFWIPELSMADNITGLNMASIKQPFISLLGRPSSGNTQNMNRIGGMEYIDGQLIVNTYEYYDASSEATHTTLVVRDALNLNDSPVDGYHSYLYGAHASGWISPIPSTLQRALGGTHITGHSSGIPIISRLSVGPSAFSIYPRRDILGKNSPSLIPMTTLLDFNLDAPLGAAESSMTIEEYLRNTSYEGYHDEENLWNHLSRASYGFIVPGTDTYMTIGYTGGLTSGVGYKITQDNGYTCGGYCSGDAADNYNYYWLWALSDLNRVKNGDLTPSEVMPYAYGKFLTPFQGLNGNYDIVGGAFDNTKYILYLTLDNADKEQSDFSPLPIILGYKLPAPPSMPTGIDIIRSE